MSEDAVSVSGLRPARRRFGQWKHDSQHWISCRIHAHWKCVLIHEYHPFESLIDFFNYFFFCLFSEYSLSNVIVAYQLVPASIRRLNSSYISTRIVAGADLPREYPASSVRIDRYLKVDLDPGASIIWDGVSGLVLEFCSCGLTWTNQGGTYLKSTQDTRSLYDYSDSWPSLQLTWPFISDSKNPSVSSVLDIKLIAGCSSNDACANGGTCDLATLKCLCQAGFFGPFCARKCDGAKQCFGNGVCSPVDGSCVCLPGFSGPSCTAVMIDPFNVARSALFGGKEPWPGEDFNTTIPFQNPGVYDSEQIPDSDKVDPFRIGGPDSLSSTESRKLQSVWTASELINSNLTAGSIISCIGLQMAMMPTDVIPNFKLSFTWLHTASALQTRILNDSEVTTVVGPMALRTDDIEYIRSAERMLLFRILPMTFDGSSHLLTQISAGGGGFTLLQNATGALFAYLQPSTQLPQGRTLSASSTSQQLLMINGTVLTLNSDNQSHSVLAFSHAPAIRLGRFISPIPQLFQVSPPHGSVNGGTRVFINGSNLGINGVDLTVDDVLVSISNTGIWRKLCSQLDWIDSQSLSCITADVDTSDPNLPAGWMSTSNPIVVRTASSGSFLSNSLLYHFNPSPVITAITDLLENIQLSGPADGGYPLLIQGQV